LGLLNSLTQDSWLLLIIAPSLISLPTVYLPYNWLSAISHQRPSFLFTDYQLNTSSKSKWKSKLLYDWLFTASQFFLAPTPWDSRP
jgi:hypothetical protein